MEEASGDQTQTQDFMNVETFSQLPFFRRPPSKDKNPKPIRLFGQDFTGQEDYKNKQEEEEEDQTGDNIKDNNSLSHNRRFECHYCFRNFPTSQALGGHQNAHKRERQLAKRVSSSSSSSYFHHPDSYSFYGNGGYRHYPSWTSSPSTRLYGGQMSTPPTLPYHKPLVNGSMLGGLWRVPPSSKVQGGYNANAAFTSYNSSSSFSSTLPLLAGSQPQPQSPHVRGPAAQNRVSSYAYRLSPNVQDHVSLDLHL